LSTRSSHSAALRLELHGSRVLCAALSALAGGALCAIAATALPLAPRLLIAAAVLARLLFLFRRQWTLRGVLLWNEGGWRWVDTGGECMLQLRAATLWPELIVLRMRESATGRSRVFTLLRDSANGAAQRELRVCLRYMPVFETMDRQEP
jgi:hypothetical protein